MPVRAKTRQLRAAVVGGSLGGLTAALLLRDLGFEVDVYERAQTRLSGFGAGIVVHEATMRYFKERAARNGSDLELEVPATYFRYLDARKDTVYEERSPYTFTAWSTVYTNLLRLFGSERYHYGYELCRFDEDGREATLQFANGRTERVDLLVCADGVLSTSRSQLTAAEPRYAGYVAWRGTVDLNLLSRPAAAILGDSIAYGVIERSHILSYPIPPPDGVRDRRLLNFVWYRNVAVGAELDELMVDRNGRRRAISLHPGSVQQRHVAELREAAAALPEPFGELVAAAPEPFVQVVVDVAVERMVSGCVCLIGDAAFAARPHAAAGTAKAAENAWKLAEALTGAPDIPDALRAWEPGQLELGRELVERSRAIGERYQVTSSARPDDQELRFGLYGPGR